MIWPLFSGPLLKKKASLSQRPGRTRGSGGMTGAHFPKELGWWLPSQPHSGVQQRYFTKRDKHVQVHRFHQKLT